MKSITFVVLPIIINMIKLFLFDRNNSITKGVILRRIVKQEHNC